MEYGICVPGYGIANHVDSFITNDLMSVRASFLAGSTSVIVSIADIDQTIAIASRYYKQNILSCDAQKYKQEIKQKSVSLLSSSIRLLHFSLELQFLSVVDTVQLVEEEKSNCNSVISHC